MKRIISLVMVVAMLASMMIVPTSAVQASMSGGCKLDFTLGKTYSAYVVKDGVIGANEYQKVNLNLDPETTDISFTAYPNDSTDYIEKCKSILSTLELYASWDEVNGVNFAVKYKPVEAPNQPGCVSEDAVQNGNTIVSYNDQFLEQLGMAISFGIRNPMLDTDYAAKVKDEFRYGQTYYRAYGRKIENGVAGDYLVGVYNQGGLGLEGSVLTQELLDSIINSTSLKDSKKTEYFGRAFWREWNADKFQPGSSSSVGGVALPEGKTRGLTQGQDFTVEYTSDGYVIYETSVKLDYILFDTELQNGSPISGSDVYFTICLCSGGVGYGMDGNENMYALSIGDMGFHRESGDYANVVTNAASFAPENAHATFSNSYFSAAPSGNTVTFKDSTKADSSSLVVSGSSITAPTAAYEGFTFEGWASAETDATETKPAVIAAGTTITPTADATYYALYSVVDGDKTFYTTKPQNGSHFVHNYTELQSDATGHWYKCYACDAIDGVQAHDFSVAQSDADNHWNDCSVCGYSDTKVAHEYNVVKYDEDGHWHECACGASLNDKAAHAQGEAFDTLHPDPEQGIEGYAKYHCTEDGCGYEFTGPFVDHVYSIWNHDDTNHWKECSCTEKDEATVAAHNYVAKSDETAHWMECECGAIIDYAEHTFEAKTDDNNHWNECACGTKKDEAAHEFVAKTDENNHWNECACGTKKDEAAHEFVAKTDANNHWSECACGTKKDEAAHDYSVVKYDEAGHWHECACGVSKNDKAEHTKGDVVKVVDPEGDAQGYTVYKCGEAGCEAEFNADFVDGVKIEEVFGDVAEGKWYYDAVEYAYKNGLMEGKGDGEFAPTKGMTRAELVTVLYRMECEPTVAYTDKFTDVAEGKWFTNAIMWAVENSIVDGFTDNTFRPNEGLTRDQLAKIMYQYTSLKGGDVTATGDLAGFPDAGSVQSWAEPFLKWAVGTGLLTGKQSGGETILAPKAATTRAEVATIMMRLGA